MELYRVLEYVGGFLLFAIPASFLLYYSRVMTMSFPSSYWFWGNDNKIGINFVFLLLQQAIMGENL